jgi:sugar phosphate permease
MNKNTTYPSLFYAWIVWTVAVLYYLYEYVQRVAPSVMVNDLMQSFQVNASTLGNLSAIYFYVYACFQIPVGMLADRYGPKRPLLIACVICSIGGLFFSMANQLYIAQISRGLIGLGSAFGYICCLRLTINWFPKKYFALMCGLVNMVGAIGAVFGETIMSHLITALTWRNILLYLSLFGGVIALLILFFVKDFPYKTQRMKPHSKHSLTAKPLLKHLFTIIKCPQVWFISFFVATIYCSFDTLASLWGGVYLEGAYGLPLTEAASIASIIFIGGVFGFPFFGYITSRLKDKNKVIMVAAALLALIASILLSFQPQSLWIVSVLFFILGFSAGALSTATELVKSQMPSEVSGLTIGVLNFTLVFVGALSQPLFGYLLQIGHSTATELSVFKETDYHRAFLLMPCLFAITLLCAICTKQKKTSA